MRNLVFLLALVAAPVFAAQQVTEDPLHRRMLDIAEDLRCAVCQNEPISESNADLARDMREIIREQLAAGKSRDEIIDYFVARYGEYVLMKPPYGGAGFWVWLGPLVLVVLIGVTGLFYIRRRLGVPLPPPPPLSEEDAARIRDAQRQAPQ